MQLIILPWFSKLKTGLMINSNILLLILLNFSENKGILCKRKDIYLFAVFFTKNNIVTWWMQNEKKLKLIFSQFICQFWFFSRFCRFAKNFIFAKFSTSNVIRGSHWRLYTMYAYSCILQCLLMRTVYSF